VILAGFNKVSPVPQTDDGDIVKRRRLPLDQMAPEDAKLAKAFAYWSSKRKDGLLPARRDIDVVDLRFLMGWMHLVDTSDPKPENYSFRLFGTSVRMDGSRNYQDFRIGDYYAKCYREALIEDYSSVVFTGVPAMHQIVALLNYLKYSYTRLILPLADDGKTVNMLLVCINKRTFADFSLDG
jgi:hypothetical protein